MMLPKLELPFELLLEQQVLADQVSPLDRALEHGQQRVGLDRLLDEAVRAGLHRLDRPWACCRGR